MAAQPISAVCSKEFYPAAHSSGKRPLSKIKWIVLHDEEALTARSAAQYFMNPESGGSAHLCVDDKECYRCLPNEAIAWGAASPNAPPGKGANSLGFHIEQGGFARWNAIIWRKKHLNTIRRAAYKSALHCKLFNIPVVFVDAPKLKAGLKGITTHREVSKAWGGDHSDPGPFYPVGIFMWWCRRYRKQLG